MMSITLTGKGFLHTFCVLLHILCLHGLTNPSQLPLPDRFYHFGTELGDEVAPVNDDGSTDRVPISTPFPYFDSFFSYLFVSIHVVAAVYPE